MFGDFKHRKPTVKDGDGNSMVWRCFSASRSGHIPWIEDKRNRFVYKHILADHMTVFVESFNITTTQNAYPDL